MVKISINALQWIATPDGWIDWSLWPEPEVMMAELRAAGFGATQVELPPGMPPEEYRKFVEAHGMELSPGYLSGFLQDPTKRPELAERFKQTAAAQAELGLTEVFVACGMDKQAPRVQSPGTGLDSTSERLDVIAETLDELARITLAEGVTALLHPHTGTWIETGEEIDYLLDKVPSDVLSLGPDTGHLAWCGVDPLQFVQRHGERIRGLHLKDLHAAVMAKHKEAGSDYRTTVLDDLWAEPGRGDLPLAGAMKALPASFEGWCVIEVDRPSGLAPLDSIRACGEWAQAQQAAS